MKTVLIGYPGSQKIRKVSEYLLRKYTNLDPVYLNYEGPIEGWSKYLVDYLKTLDDKEIIFALDDYLISQLMVVSYENMLPGTACIKLCECSKEENMEYPVTTQYTLWNRKKLIWLLKQTTTPWDFEINGSKIFKQSGLGFYHLPVLKYYTNSSLSKRWNGVSLEGLNEEDKIKVRELL